MTAPASGGAPPRDFGSLVLRGLGWILGTQVIAQLTGLVASVLIARFLGPRQVGLAGMALVFTSLALVLLDFGVGSALIQRPQLSDDDVNSAFWASLVLGLGLTLIGVGLSWPIAALYGEPEVQRLFAVLSISFLFSAPSIVPEALLARDLGFKVLRTRNLIATVVSCALAVLLAALGAKAWAIVGQDLTITAVTSYLMWRRPSWRPALHVSRQSLHGMRSFAMNVFGARTLDWAGKNCDNLLVGRVLGAGSLGIYSLAYGIVVAPAKWISMPVMQVFFPAFSRLRDREAIRSVWLRANRMLALLVLPVLLGVVAVSPDFVELVFGPRWHAAVGILRLLAVVGVGQALTTLNWGILQAIDRTGVLFRYVLTASVATVAAFAIGLVWGLTGVAVAYLIVSAVLNPVLVVLTTRELDVSPWRWAGSIAGVAEAGAGMLLAVFLLRAELVSSHVATAPRLVLCVLAGAWVYVVLVLWRAPEVGPEFAKVRQRLSRRREEKGPATTAGPEGEFAAPHPSGTPA